MVLKMGRRNLNDFWKAKYGLLIKEELAKDAEERQLGKLKQFQVSDNEGATVDQNSGRRYEDQDQRTDRKIASNTGLSYDKTCRMVIRKTKEFQVANNEESTVHQNSGERANRRENETDRKIASDIGLSYDKTFCGIFYCALFSYLLNQYKIQ